MDAEAAAAGRGGRRIAAAKLRSRPRLYLAVVILALIGAFALHERRDGIFACPAAYSDDVTLVYCNASDYGEYDHGAFWFGLMPRAVKAAAAADVLFLGNSRVNHGFSTASTDHWFADRKRTYYLLGFAYYENASFTGPLLRVLKPRARAVVINVDGFFSDELTVPAKAAMTGLGAQRGLMIKGAWRGLHRAACGLVAALCGDAWATYRNLDTGQWRRRGFVPPYTQEPPTEGPADPAAVGKARAIAEPFLQGLGIDRRCVIFTYVWTTHSKRREAEALAHLLGVAFVAPRLDGLQTYDGSHLDQASAERFSEAFFAEAGPELAACLDDEPR